ncbi:MAG: undecaprenyl/decaprenyl-phosphate alpha-N-acetylglucosaminyl 1-phosphate transferase [Prochlorococcus marinus CUG1436]|nr:undecaprenyl/decaprenyl-phosphate alpha-N-acetylglucosaminyl 1-phosphate transferase [Prochlorococcus marinus CUG1436]
MINPLFIILIGSFFYFLIGLHDDIFKSSPFLRLILQFSVALAVSNYGVNFGSINFSIPYYGEINIILPAYIDHILTSFWIVGITNAINWIDGMDGLAAGYTSILSLGLCTLMLIQGNFIGILFFSLLLGSILGFLIRNFKPAYYIMGDCGSNFLGFCLSASSLVFLRDLKFDSINFFFLILIFSLPIIDMLIVITRRILRGKSIFRPDRSHFHHKLMDWNFDYKEIIFINYFYSTITICAGIFYQNQF